MSLVFGTMFAGFTLVWLVGVTGHLDHHDAWWAGPVVLVVAGVAGLVASLRQDGSSEQPSSTDESPTA
ncbi:MAG: hypothetical protein M3O94_09870 [Actinomycetota bacterium]|nr:hypothetical protein [Actinomycetota bacterium]